METDVHNIHEILFLIPLTMESIVFLDSPVIVAIFVASMSRINSLTIFRNLASEIFERLLYLLTIVT